MNFRKVAGELPVAPLLAALAGEPQLWERHTLRQEFFCSPHWATQSIYLRGPRAFTFEDYFMDTGAFPVPGPEDVEDAAANLVSRLLVMTNAGELGRVLIVKLPPGGVLIEHVDEGVYAEHYERIHVALATNERAVLVCNDEAMHVPVGEAWWFDHRAPHTARNMGDSERVHLIVDLVAPGLRGSDAD